ncbi:MAG TPA: 4-(cytidine 5'-diphospho)-2-C-methyl-D-erythritol kinase [Pyrinomonadaceae bacterium]|nr:4-(cytidine 5'-diphospho)-2-C-methyl-D-erythritol kinase [Pyrinomonadaceae bacterium]
MPKEIFTLPSFAKINWFLRVLGKRDDGYHELCTLFQTISLADEITFSVRDELSLTCSDPRIPTDENNLIIKAANALREKFTIKLGAKIHLEKRIPAPAGLGGGSSNAAVTLIGLRKLWNLKIEILDLIKIGENLGADVPFFFFGGTCIGTGNGTNLQPTKDLEENYLLIVKPDVDVPTREAFARLNAPRLTKFDSKSILQICRNEALSFNSRQNDLKNDFEPSVFAIEPEIRRVKEKLLLLGAIKVLMSGSGASVFGIFDNKETRQATQQALEVEKNWRQFAAATVSRDEYYAKVVSD